MRHRLRPIAALALATVAMLLSAASSSASIFSASNRPFRVVWNPVTSTDNAGNPVAECPLTLEGSFHSQTIAKVIRSLVGYISRAVVASTEPPCIGATATILSETLPWHLSYEGFSGRLPNITFIRFLLRGISDRINIFGTNCLYRDEGEGAAGEVIIQAGTALLTISPDPGIRLKKRSGGVLCPAFAGFTGTSNSITSLGTSTKVSISLI